MTLTRRERWLVHIAPLLLLIPCTADAASESPTAIRAIFDQTPINRCGPIALQVCANVLNVPLNLDHVVEVLPNDGRLTTFAELRRAADSIGLQAKPVRWNGSPGMLDSAPAILAVQLKGAPHFVAAVGKQGDDVLIVDFPDAAWISLERLRTEYDWKGEALHVSSGRTPLAALWLWVNWRQVLSGACALVVLWGLGSRFRRGRISQARQRKVLACALLFAAASGCETQEPSSRRLAVRLQPETITLQLSENQTDLNQEVVLYVENLGKEDATIRRVIASCGCTAIAEPSRKRLPPRQKAAIPIKLDMPPTGVRESRVDVLVETASGQRTLSSRLVMRGRPISIPALVDAPDDFTLERDALGAASIRLGVRTYEKAMSPAWIRGLVCDSPAVSVRSLGMEDVRTSAEDIVERSYSYEVTVNPSLEKSPDAAAQQGLSMQLHAIDSELPLRKIYGRIEEWKPLRVSPRALFVDWSRTEGDLVEKTVRIEVRDAEFQPTELIAEGSAPWIQIASVQQSEGHGRGSIVKVELSHCSEPDGAAERAELTIRACGQRGESVVERIPVVSRGRAQLRDQKDGREVRGTSRAPSKQHLGMLRGHATAPPAAP